MLTPSGYYGASLFCPFAFALPSCPQPTGAVHIAVGHPDHPDATYTRIPLFDHDDETGERRGSWLVDRPNGEVIHVLIQERIRAHAIRFVIGTRVVRDAWEDVEEDTELDSAMEDLGLIDLDTQPTLQRPDLTHFPQDDMRWPIDRPDSLIEVLIQERIRPHATRFQIETKFVRGAWDYVEDDYYDIPLLEDLGLIEPNIQPTLQRSYLTISPQDDMRDQVVSKDGDAETIYILAVDLPGGTTLAAMDVPNKSLIRGMNY